MNWFYKWILWKWEGPMCIFCLSLIFPWRDTYSPRSIQPAQRDSLFRSQESQLNWSHHSALQCWKLEDVLHIIFSASPGAIYLSGIERVRIWVFCSKSTCKIDRLGCRSYPRFLWKVHRFCLIALYNPSAQTHLFLLVLANSKIKDLSQTVWHLTFPHHWHWR